jgi:flavin-dependent dehydrogenase
MEIFDALVVGGGPAGSSCARKLVSGGLRVAVLDAARFPRVKLCAGWVSPPVWRELELLPGSYPHGLWEWGRMHVHLAGRTHTERIRGYFIRRFEFDQFLLQRSGAEVREHRVQKIEREGAEFVVDGAFSARFLVGGGGTNCPVARQLFLRKERKPVATQEREFEAGAGAVAARRMGGDGEPEILLHDDLGGYSWNIPKTGWVNVGCGTVQPRALLPAWREARAFFENSGHLPDASNAALDEVKGHSYHLFRSQHLAAGERGGAAVIGDALGLAHPVTGEGILPAVVSGGLCAKAILSGRIAEYPDLLARNRLFRDYRVIAALVEGASRARAPSRLGPLLSPLVAKLFALSFSARALPAGGVLSRGLDLLRRPGARHD